MGITRTETSERRAGLAVYVPRLHRPHVAPRARSLTLQTAQRARRAKWELAVADPAVRPDARRVHRARADLRRGHAGPRRRRGGDGDPRLGARARPRPLHRAGAVPAHGPGDGRHRGLPDPVRVPDRGGDRVAARRRAGPGHAGSRRCDHRGRHRSRGAADAWQPDRRAGADLGAAVQGRRPRAPAGGRPRRPGRGRSWPRSGCSTRHSRRARTRSWSRTTSCSRRPSSRCASPPRSTCARACGPTCGRATSRRCSRTRSRRPSAASRRSRSRRSTPTRSSSASRRPRCRTPTARASPTRSWRRSAPRRTTATRTTSPRALAPRRRLARRAALPLSACRPGRGRCCRRSSSRPDGAGPRRPARGRGRPGSRPRAA